MIEVMRAMKNFTITMMTAAAVAAVSCAGIENPTPDPAGGQETAAAFSLQEVAKIFSSLPIGDEHLREVYSAVSSSSSNGYDEEYMLRDLFENPGAGVGDPPTKAGSGYDKPLCELFREYLVSNYSTKASAADVEAVISSMVSSDMQIYWPYSEDWDGSTYPIVTFDPGYGAESNYGYVIRAVDGGVAVVDSVLVDEAVAKTRPVWVINNNDDSAYSPLEFVKSDSCEETQPAARKRRLILKSFKMLRNYDSWFGGASEFRIQMGSVDGFTASTEAELNLYKPSVTDFYLVIKRKYVGTDYPYEGIILTDFTNQIDKLAFLITEDDGGTKTTWKCSATVKVQSKSYGFEIEFPYNEKDDIVWRGQLDADFLKEEDTVSGRFGDVIVTFELD